MRGVPFEFSEEQIQYIVENWGKESVHQMKTKIGCTWNAVAKVAEEYGLEIPTSNDWTEEEIELLKQLAPYYSYQEISKKMNRSETAVYKKATRLGIPLLQNKRAWTKEEEEILQNDWGSYSVEFIASELHRTPSSVKVKATRMKIGSMRENGLDILSIPDLEEMLGVSRSRIQKTWTKLGLILQKRRLSSKASYYYVTWENLLSFLEEHQEEWDSRLVEPYMLGEEFDWLAEKRKKDRDENPLWYRRWTEEEINLVEVLHQRGDSYQEIAQRLQRSDNAVRWVLKNLGYPSFAPRMWSEEEELFLKDNYNKIPTPELALSMGRSIKSISDKAHRMGYQKRRKR